MPGQPQCDLRSREPLKSPLHPNAPRRVKRPHAATQMKRVQRANGSLAQSGARPQCGLLSREPLKSSLYPSALRRVKRTHIANQMKRVQRANGSLAQSGARSPSVLPAGNMAKPIRSRKNALCLAADSVLRPSRLFVSRPFVLRRDRHKETHSPEVNQQSRITTRHPRTHEWRSRSTAEQERNISQAVLFGAQAANSRRDRA